MRSPSRPLAALLLCLMPLAGCSFGGSGSDGDAAAPRPKPTPTATEVPGGIGPGLAPPPPPESRGPKLLTMQAGNELLAINPNVRPYRVNVPEELTDRMGAGEKISPVIRICVTAQGSVHSVALLESSLPLIDQQLPSVIRRWKYRPLLVAGESRPFCYVTKYSIAAT